MHNTDETSLRRTASACGRCSERGEAVEAQENSGVCGCGENSESTWGLRGYPLASVYSPLQNFTDIYDCENALIRGTIFAQLDLPFVCGGMTGGVSRG